MLSTFLENFCFKAKGQKSHQLSSTSSDSQAQVEKIICFLNITQQMPDFHQKKRSPFRMGVSKMNECLTGEKSALGDIRGIWNPQKRDRIVSIGLLVMFGVHPTFLDQLGCRRANCNRFCPRSTNWYNSTLLKRNIQPKKMQFPIHSSSKAYLRVFHLRFHQGPKIP